MDNQKGLPITKYNDNKKLSISNKKEPAKVSLAIMKSFEQPKTQTSSHFHLDNDSDKLSDTSSLSSINPNGSFFTLKKKTSENKKLNKEVIILDEENTTPDSILDETLILLNHEEFSKIHSLNSDYSIDHSVNEKHPNINEQNGDIYDKLSDPTTDTVAFPNTVRVLFQDDISYSTSIDASESLATTLPIDSVTFTNEDTSEQNTFKDNDVVNNENMGCVNNADSSNNDGDFQEEEMEDVVDIQEHKKRKLDRFTEEGKNSKMNNPNTDEDKNSFISTTPNDSQENRNASLNSQDTQSTVVLGSEPIENENKSKKDNQNNINHTSTLSTPIESTSESEFEGKSPKNPQLSKGRVMSSLSVHKALHGHSISSPSLQIGHFRDNSPSPPAQRRKLKHNSNPDTHHKPVQIVTNNTPPNNPSNSGFSIPKPSKTGTSNKSPFQLNSNNNNVSKKRGHIPFSPFSPTNTHTSSQTKSSDVQENDSLSSNAISIMSDITQDSNNSYSSDSSGKTSISDIISRTDPTRTRNTRKSPEIRGDDGDNNQMSDFLMFDIEFDSHTSNIDHSDNANNNIEKQKHLKSNNLPQTYYDPGLSQLRNTVYERWDTQPVDPYPYQKLNKNPNYQISNSISGEAVIQGVVISPSPSPPTVNPSPPATSPTSPPIQSKLVSNISAMVRFLEGNIDERNRGMSDLGVVDQSKIITQSIPLIGTVLKMLQGYSETLNHTVQEEVDNRQTEKTAYMRNIYQLKEEGGRLRIALQKASSTNLHLEEEVENLTKDREDLVELIQNVKTLYQNESQTMKDTIRVVNSNMEELVNINSEMEEQYMNLIDVEKTKTEKHLLGIFETLVDRVESDCQDKLHQASLVLQQQDEQILQLQQELLVSGQSLESKDTRISTLSLEGLKLQHSIDKLEENISTKDNSIRSLEQQIQDKDQEIQRLKNSNTKMQGMYENLLQLKEQDDKKNDEDRVNLEAKMKDINDKLSIRRLESRNQLTSNLDTMSILGSPRASSHFGSFMTPYASRNLNQPRKFVDFDKNNDKIVSEKPSMMQSPILTSPTSQLPRPHTTPHSNDINNNTNSKTIITTSYSYNSTSKLDNDNSFIRKRNLFSTPK